MKRWCPRWDSNPRPQDSYHFGFHRLSHCDRLWSGLSLHHRENPLGAARPVSTPSLKGLGSGLAFDFKKPSAFPDFEQIRLKSFLSKRPIVVSGILCSILLSYADFIAAEALTNIVASINHFRQVFVSKIPILFPAVHFWR